MANKFRYPTGVRPLLVDEARRRRWMESRFVEMLSEAGFDEVLLPIIDYVEPYAPVVSREATRQSYRFVDREGELVAIRSDFTPMIARALGPTLSAADLPLRVFYRGDVIRCEATRLGVNREMFQIGAEIIGDDSIAADVRTLTLAASCLGGFGIRPLVTYTDVSIAAAILGSASSDEERAAIRAALVSKRTTGLAGATPLARTLAAGTATLDDIAAWEPTSAAARRLRAIAAAVEDVAGADFVLQLDDVEASAGYYTGLRFRMYGGPARARLAQGGRYDTLYAQFGEGTPAIGFTFTVDDVTDAAPESGSPIRRGRLSEPATPIRNAENPPSVPPPDDRETAPETGRSA